MISAARELLRAAFMTAVAAADPAALVERSDLLARLVSDPPRGRAVILAIGKGAAAMAAALEARWPLVGPPTGLVIAPYGAAFPQAGLTLLHARHPHPDDASAVAGSSALALVRGLTTDDRLLVLLTGGGSSLTTLPAKGVSMRELAALIESLMHAGATIAEINCVRKHLGRVSGGGLAQACTAGAIDVLALSDVPGDELNLIASGPFCADPTFLAEARQVLARYGIAPPPSVATALRDPANETPRSGNACFAKVRAEVVPAAIWIAPCTALLERHGYAVGVIGAEMNGDARDIAEEHAREALAASRSPTPRALLSGGEATVVVRGNGYGGPNAQTALHFADLIGGHLAITALFADTDGIDGPTHNAGAFVGPDTLSHADKHSFSVARTLTKTDSAALFDAIGDALQTGPTGTNVNDFRLVLIN